MARRRKEEKNDLIKAVKDISRKMDDFNDSVSNLLSLKDTLLDLDDELAERQKNSKDELEEVERSFQTNKLKAVSQAARELSMELVSREELNTMKEASNKSKQLEKETIDRMRQEMETSFNDKLSVQLKLNELQFQRDSSKLEAQVEAQKSEIENLKNTLQRMSQELDSQKKLTAEVAGISRPKDTKSA